MSLVTRAPGKLVLLGEYAVLRGAPALVQALDREVTVSLESGDSGEGAACLIFTCPQIGVQQKTVECPSRASQRREPECPSRASQRQEHSRVTLDERAGADTDWPTPLIRTVVDAVLVQCEKAGRALPGASITIDSASFFEGERKLGIGSSAAVCVALMNGLLRSAGIEPSRADLFVLARDAHRTAQGGSGSGVDIAASTYGGLLEYRIDQQPKATTLPPGVSWIAVTTETSSSTPGLVRRILGGVDSDEAARSIFVELGAAAEEGAHAARSRDAAAFLAATRQFISAYRRLGEACGVDLFGHVHDDVAAAASQAGALYKPSGAGAGDLGVAFGSQLQLEALATSLPAGARRL
ncbi:MAG: hypothetical protein RL885_26545 [Planctomycetota bacterium]